MAHFLKYVLIAQLNGAFMKILLDLNVRCYYVVGY
jgi:hypothetical protein